MVLSDSDSVTTLNGSKIGPWEIEFRASSLTTNGEEFQFYFLRQDGNNWYKLKILEDGNLGLDKSNSGSASNIGSGTWPGDTAPHRFKIERVSDPGETRYIVSVDGTEKINVTDSFLPSANQVRFTSFYNNDVYIPFVKFG